VRYVLPVTSKRTKAKPTAEPPITGVAGGSLGTAANLDDTQVLATEDLKAAAPAWLDDDAPGVAGEPPASVPPVPLAAPVETPAPRKATVALVATPPASAPPASAPPASAPPASAPLAQPVAVRPSTRSRRSMPALAGVAALVLLLLVAGSGFLSQLDLGLGTGPAGPGATAGALVEAQASPTAEPKEAGKGNGKCHGKGRGNHCGGD